MNKLIKNEKNNCYRQALFQLLQLVSYKIKGKSNGWTFIFTLLTLFMRMACYLNFSILTYYYFYEIVNPKWCLHFISLIFLAVYSTTLDLMFNFYSGETFQYSYQETKKILEKLDYIIINHFQEHLSNLTISQKLFIAYEIK